MHLSSPATTIFSDFREALLELITNYSSEVPLVNEAITSKVAGELTAIIGLSDPQFAASVTLTTTEASAVNLSYLVPAIAGDWLGELANQLAGRMKNKLTRYGLSPRLGIATIVRGKWIQIESFGTSACLATARFKHGEVTAQLALDLSPDLQLIVKDEQTAAAEGTMVLF